VDQELIKKVLDTTKKKIKNINYEEKNTIIEFEDGECLVLNGGVNNLHLKHNIRCSYCGSERSKSLPLISSDIMESVFICPKCAAQALSLFINSGIDIEIALPILEKNQ
jgi:hypothetical protein